MGEAAVKALALDPDLALARALYESSTIEDWSYARELTALERAALEQPNNAEILSALAYDLIGAGYFREALAVAERLVELDPLSPTANACLVGALYALERTDEAIAELELQARLGIDLARWNLALTYLAEMQDERASMYMEGSAQRSLYPQDPGWAREFVSRAQDPVDGHAYLDRHVSEAVASVPLSQRYSWSLVQSDWYLLFRHLDRYYDLPLETELTASTWTDAERFIQAGTMNRRLGFTAHPKYLEVAHAVGITDVWNHRGPPDFCRKVKDHWVCE
jgi:tetratricopeptide (TPR) repeat protein